MSSKKQKAPSHIIADNRKARHDYHIGETFEAGLVLEGWEVKSLRAGRAQLKESYVVLKNGEASIIGMHISPLKNCAAHTEPNPTRTRKLLLHRRELSKIFASVQQKGNSAVVLNLHWTRNRVKAEIALGKGKKTHDKRETIKKKDIQRETGRILKG